MPTRNRTRRLPEFISLTGDIVPHSSYMVHNAIWDHYLLPGDIVAMTKTCNRWFRKPSLGRFTVKPFVPFVLLSFVNVSCRGECNYTDTPCGKEECPHAFLPNNRGSIKYNSMRLSMFVEDENKKRYLFSPYVFIDDGQWFALSREMFGMPSTVADFTYPKVREDGTDHVPTPYMDCKIVVPYEKELTLADTLPKTVLKIHQTDYEPIAPSMSRNCTSNRMCVSKLERHLGKNINARNSENITLSTIKEMAKLMGLQGRFISLRQYRAAAISPESVYKAIVDYRCANVKLHSEQEIPGKFVVNFPDKTGPMNKNYPMWKDLGIEGKTSIAAFRMNADFQYQTGKELWNPLRR